MKNKLKYIKILTTLMILLVVSCDKEWLEPEPLSFFSPENVLVDAAGFESLLVTSQLITTDIGFAPPRNTSSPRDLPLQLTPSSDGSYDMLDYFDKAYEVIRTANVVIDNIDNATWNTEEEKNSVLAAGYFHRSFWYYTLINIFGDVPFINKQVEGARFKKT